MPRAWVTIDLGFGDSGKGTITEVLVRKHDAKLVVRYSGGCQCAHNVVLSNGTHHTFAQYGSGSLAGAGTLLTNHVLVDPLRLRREYEVLLLKVGSIPRIYIHERALITTPFHAALNRLKERTRGDGRHGSCGVGIGETTSYALTQHQVGGWKDSVPVIGMMDKPDSMTYALQCLRDSLLPKAEEARAKLNESNDDWELFQNDYLIDALVHRYRQYAQDIVRVIGDEEMLDLIRSQDTVWEGSQGVLLDEDVGFHPYTTWSRTNGRNAYDALTKANVTDTTNIGVLRAYGHRHGPGPFPSENEIVRPFVAEPHNPTNEWQREFRVGWFDSVMTRYALKVAGRIDEVAITHVDRIAAQPQWSIVDSYAHGEIPVIDATDFAEREKLTQRLMDERVNRMSVSTASYLHYLKQFIQPPITIESRGATYEDKVFV